MPAFSVLAAGLGFGLSVAAPVGPIGLICMNRTLASGFRYGFIGGLGTAAADACYGLLAVAGLYLVADWLQSYSLALEITGGLFVAYLGTVGLLKAGSRSVTVAKYRGGKPSSGEAAPRLMHSFVSMFGLTLTNPMTMLSFLALAASLQATAAADSLTLAAGIFLGSSVWWLLLCSVVHWAGKALPSSFQRYLHLLSNLMLLAFGLVRTCVALTAAA